MLYKLLSWKVTFPITSKPTPPTVFNLQALDWVHCEEEKVRILESIRQNYKLLKKILFVTIVDILQQKKYAQIK